MTRVFSPFRKTVIFIYAFMAVMLGYYIPAVIVKIRICDPISRFWDRSVHGTCLDETSIILADAVVSVVSDLIILIMPLPLTMSLQMANKKKIRVMGLLGAGGLAVTATIIRLALIVTTGQSKDSTFAFMRINMLGYVLQASHNHDNKHTNLNPLYQQRRNCHGRNLHLSPRPLRPPHPRLPRILQQQSHLRLQDEHDAKPAAEQNPAQQGADERAGPGVGRGRAHVQRAGQPAH